MEHVSPKNALVVAGLALGAAFVGYALGTKESEEKQTGRRNKIVNELKAEREEILQQLTDNAKREKKRHTEDEFEKLREENRLLRQQLNDQTPEQLFELYINDYDVLSQQVWLTLLEKKVHFKTIFVNSFNKDLEQTKKFLELNPSGIGPAGIHRGEKLSNATDMIWYIDEALPEPPLSPTDSAAKYRMRAVIEQHKPVEMLWWALLTELDPTKRPGVAKQLEKAIRDFDEAIVGPYITGRDFTLADIVYLPVFERIDAVLGHFREFKVPPQCDRVLIWLKTCYNRESFQKTTERTEESLRVIPWVEKERILYLREAFEPIAAGRYQEIQAALAKSTKPLSDEERRKIIYPQQ